MSRAFWLLCCLCALQLGCDDPVVCVDPGGCGDSPDGGQRLDGAPTPEPEPGEPEPPPDPEPEPEAPCELPGGDAALIALDYYQTELEGRLYTSCAAAAGCHPFDTVDPGDLFFQMYTGGPDGLDEAQHRTNARDALSLIDRAAPRTSELIVHHDGTVNETTPDIIELVARWIDRIAEDEAAYCAPDPEPEPGVDMGVDPPDGGGGDPLVDCDALPRPDSDLGYSAGYYAAFIEPDGEGITLDAMLVQTCATVGCHVRGGSGEGYVLQTDGGECATRWNFLTTQWFVTPADVPRSPILLQPLDRDHGGRVVFDGRDDPKYVRLARWLEDEFQAR